MKLKWPSWFRSSGKTDPGLRSPKKMASNICHKKRALDTGSIRSLQYQQRVTPVEDSSVEAVVRVNEQTDSDTDEDEDLSVSFGYQCRKQAAVDEEGSNVSIGSQFSDSCPLDLASPSQTFAKLISRKSSSFSCLSGAALSANATLANTTLGNGLIGEEILPGLDSPRTFRKLKTSASSGKVDVTRYFPGSAVTSPTVSPTITIPQSSSAPTRLESVSFLNANDVQTAGGAAGEDRVQAVCSEENGWLFCGIYDGFNGRDAADFLAGTFYENVGLHLKLLEWHVQREQEFRSNSCSMDLQLQDGADTLVHMDKTEQGGGASELDQILDDTEFDVDEIYKHGVMRVLERAFVQTEADFLEMVEQEMEDRAELVMVGSCVLAVLMHGQDLYTLNVGDSRAVLATTQPPENSIEHSRVNDTNLWAVQMTESHVLENITEYNRVLSEHPEDPMTISGGRLKGKLKVTRAFGAGYMKKAKLNNALMGILRVRNLCSPPYLGVIPCVSAHRLSEADDFVVLGSDGLFDFFTNEEVVSLVHKFVSEYPTGNPAKYMLEQLLFRAAENAGMSVDQLKGIPIGRRRKYHDDVTVIIISLGAQFPTSTASTVSV